MFYKDLCGFSWVPVKCFKLTTCLGLIFPKCKIYIIGAFCFSRKCKGAKKMKVKKKHLTVVVALLAVVGLATFACAALFDVIPFGEVDSTSYSDVLINPVVDGGLAGPARPGACEEGSSCSHESPNNHCCWTDTRGAHQATCQGSDYDGKWGPSVFCGQGSICSGGSGVGAKCVWKMDTYT
jgi:hypothetical protein